jgi:hypothetical protein
MRSSWASLACWPARRLSRAMVLGLTRREPAGLADAAALGDVLQDRLDLLRREPGIEPGRARALGEPGLAGAAAEHASGLTGPVAAGQGQVSGAPLALVGAVTIPAAEAGEVVPGVGPAVRSSGWTPSCVRPKRETTGMGRATLLIR